MKQYNNSSEIYQKLSSVYVKYYQDKTMIITIINETFIIF